MILRHWSVAWCACLITLTSLPVCYSRAVVQSTRSQRMVREAFPDGTVLVATKEKKLCIVGELTYWSGEAVPSTDPCKQCVCQAPDVVCSPMICNQTNPGCKAIQRPDKCCPTYQCECTHNGRTYANGERLDKNENECSVCYCRGGEIQCAKFQCYERDDCTPVRVPGQCCPKYDHCPPRDSKPDYSTSSSIESKQRDSIEKDIDTNAPINPASFQSNLNDDISAENILLNSASLPNNDLNEGSGDDSREVTDIKMTTEVFSSLKSDPEPKKSSNQKPQITIKEVLPTPPKREINEEPQIKNEIKDKPNEGKLEKSEYSKEPTDTELIPSTPSLERNSDEQPSHVLKIGNELLVLKDGELVVSDDTNTSSSVFKVIGTEGLQRGVEEIDEVLQEETDIGKSIESTEDPEIISVETATYKGISNTLPTIYSIESIDILNMTIPEDSEHTDPACGVIAAEESKENDCDETGHTEDRTNSLTEGPTKIPIPVEDTKDNLPELSPEYPPLPEIMLPELHEDIAENTTSEIKPPTLDTIDLMINENASLSDLFLNEKITSEENETDEEDGNENEEQYVDMKSLLTPEPTYFSENDTNRAEGIDALPSEWLKGNDTGNATEANIETSTKSINTIIEQMKSIEAVIDHFNSMLNDDPNTHMESEEKDSGESTESNLIDKKYTSNSKETVEDTTDSGERVTEVNQRHASILSNEDASVQIMNEESAEMNPDVEIVSPVLNSNIKDIESKNLTEVKSVEENTRINKDVADIVKAISKYRRETSDESVLNILKTIFETKYREE